jgi:hypothetical protein
LKRACSPRNFSPPSLPTQISLMTSTRDSKALFTMSLTPLHFEHSQAMENLGSSPRKRVPGFLRRCLNSKCPSSGQVPALVFTPDTTFPFLLEMRCDHCNAMQCNAMQRSTRVQLVPTPKHSSPPRGKFYDIAVIIITSGCGIAR